MSDKKIPVMVGDIPIGRASVEELPDGTKIVNVSIDDVQWGSWSVGGFFPMRLVGVLPVNHQQRSKRDGSS
jgi:hypothetical protein